MLTYIVHRYLTPKCTYNSFVPFLHPKTTFALLFLFVAATNTSARISTFFILSGREKSVPFSDFALPQVDMNCFYV